MNELQEGYYALFCLDDTFETIETAEFTFVFKCIKLSPEFATVEWEGNNETTREKIDMRRCLEVYPPNTNPEYYL